MFRIMKNLSRVGFYLAIVLSLSAGSAYAESTEENTELSTEESIEESTEFSTEESIEESTEFSTEESESLLENCTYLIPVEKLEWAATIANVQDVLGKEKERSVSNDNIVSLKYDAVDTVFGELDDVEFLFLSDKGNKEDDTVYWLYSIKLSVDDSIENVKTIVTETPDIELQNEDNSEEDAVNAALLSKDEWKLENIPAETWIRMCSFADENVPWVNLSLDDFLVSVSLSSTDDSETTLAEYQAGPYVVNYLSEEKILAESQLHQKEDMTAKKWQPVMGVFKWGMSQKEAADIAGMKEVESDKEDYVKYQLEREQTIFDCPMDVYLYFDSAYDLGLTEVVCEFDKDSYDDVHEAFYETYGTAAVTHAGASVGSIYSMADIIESLKRIGVEKADEEMIKLAKLDSEKSLCIASLTNSEKSEKAKYSITAYNMALFAAE